jgi:putative lipoic acid-binding regulatory protein
MPTPEDIPALPAEYPALYTFRVITRQGPGVRDRVRLLVQAIAGTVPDDAVTERLSSAGNYRALHVTCLLASEEMRRDVYMRLSADPSVLMTL